MLGHDPIIKPKLRGRMHLVAAGASIIGLIYLVQVAPNTRALVAAWVYGIGAVLLYLTSSTYHVFARSPRSRWILQRADHSMIYILIAASFTPTCVLVLGGTWRWVLLAVVWAGALGGVLLKLLAMDRYPKIGNGLYIVLGWSGMFALPALVQRPTLLALVFAAGVLYTTGAILFALRKPTLSPRWFGYHEVWHTFVTAAGALLFIANLALVRAG
jgi:hemolysin III